MESKGNENKGNRKIRWILEFQRMDKKLKNKKKERGGGEERGHVQV